MNLDNVTTSSISIAAFFVSSIDSNELFGQLCLSGEDLSILRITEINAASLAHSVRIDSVETIYEGTSEPDAKFRASSNRGEWKLSFDMGFEVVYDSHFVSSSEAFRLMAEFNLCASDEEQWSFVERNSDTLSRVS